MTLLAVPVLFLQANLKSPTDVNAVDRLVLRLSAPIQAAVSGAVGGIQRGWRRYVYLVDLQAQNERLARDLTRLRLELQEAQRNASQLGRYERMLAFRAQHGIETVGARVIGRQSSPFARALRLRLDRGAPQLRSGLPVVTADGVVGRVGKVYGPYSEVSLTVDPRSAIDVVIQRTGSRGMLRGTDGGSGYRCRMDYLLRKEEVRVGDLVVTSGVAGGFPRGLPVGRISRVTQRTYGLYQEVEVTPMVDFSSLEDVLIILAPPPPPVARAGGEAEPASGLLP
ncbi:MAG: rod shape-determining protein MreC [Deltaproteobacteria bacterium]|nr:rod shape-determining protein MreC [Deltaproteobacteria bacterium]